MTDVLSYKVTNQHRRSQVLHQNQLLLIASEVGIPLCMGDHHTQYRCTSPTPCKTTSLGGDKMLMPQEQNGKAFTRRPTRKASQGWKNGKLWLGLWTSTRASTAGWVKTSGKVIWLLELQRNTYIRQRDRRLYPLMLVDSEPKEECCHSLNWVTADKAKIQMGGVKWVSEPTCRNGEQEGLPCRLTRNATHLPRGTSADYRGMTLYPTERPNQQY